MRSEFRWIEEIPHGMLAVMPRPAGFDALPGELEFWRASGVDVVVSLLTFSEEIELGLEEEAVVCNEFGINFISFPIADRQVPDSARRVRALATSLARLLKENKSIVIHCRMGIGRSGMIAAYLLVQQGLTVFDAFNAVSKARRVPIPDTAEQRVWVETMSRDANLDED